MCDSIEIFVEFQFNRMRCAASHIHCVLVIALNYSYARDQQKLKRIIIEMTFKCFS